MKKQSYQAKLNLKSPGKKLLKTMDWIFTTMEKKDLILKTPVVLYIQYPDAQNKDFFTFKDFNFCDLIS